MSKKFTLVYKEPIIGNNSELGQLNLSSWQQNIVADGGYESASGSTEITYSELNNWLENGLMRDIHFFDHALVKGFEGFVNQVKIKVGALVINRGPIVEIVNKVAVIYQTQTYNTNPPIPGERVVSGFAEDSDSQDRYGTFETYLSGGTGGQTEMEQARDTFLFDHKDPETTYDLTIGSASTPQLTLEILGYKHLLNRYHFSDTGVGKHNASVRITDVLTADPDSIFSSNYDNITTNALQVGVTDDDQHQASGVIADVVKYGDASDNRYLFGVYNDRVAYYNAIPTTVEYQHFLRDREQRITQLGGNTVYPWNVRPGKWLLLDDFLVGGAIPTNLAQLRNDPRAVFIESVKYSSPWGLQINGGKVYTIGQKLAKLGLGG